LREEEPENECQFVEEKEYLSIYFLVCIDNKNSVSCVRRDLTVIDSCVKKENMYMCFGEHL